MTNVIAEITDLDPTRISVATSYFHKDLISSIPGARFSPKDNTWKVPIGWAGCLALRSTFRGALEIGPNLSKWANAEINDRIRPAMALRDAITAEGSDKLFEFQRAGVQFMTVGKRILLADEMGAGKTRQALMTLMNHYVLGKNPFPTLVVCPNSTKITWMREAKLVWPDLTVQIIRGSAAQRRKQFETPAHLYVINWEGLRGHSRLAPYGSMSLKRCVECGGEDRRVTVNQCEVHKRELNQIEFGAVIGDEIHRMKDPKSKQSRALVAATGDADIRIGLTGTPVASAPDDLWPIMHWLSPEEWPSRRKYIDRMLDVSYNAFGAATVVGIKPHMREEFFAAIDPRLRRMPKELVLSYLPPVVYDRRDVEMGVKQKKAYKQMTDLMIAELDGGDVVMTTSPLVKMIRLLQFASSFATLDVDEEGKTRVRLSDPSCKLDAFMDDIPDFGDDAVVVFAVSRQLIEMLSARMTKKDIPHGLITGAQNQEERQQHMDDFQAGRTKFILCTIAAGGTGITLTAGRIAAFLQRSWSMIDNSQAEARVHRIGSEIHDSILVIDYVTENTIEDRVIDAVQHKTEMLEQVLRDRDLLRRLLDDDDGNI